MAQDSMACPVCGIAVSFENCKVDEQGRAVHESCYLSDLEKLKSPPDSKERVPESDS